MRASITGVVLFLLAVPAASLETSRIQTRLAGAAPAAGDVRTSFDSERAGLELRVRGLASHAEHVLLAKLDPGDADGAEILRFATGGKGNAHVSLDLIGDEAGAPADPRGRYLALENTGGGEVLGAWLFGSLSDDAPGTKTKETTSLAPNAGAPGRVDARYSSRAAGAVSFEIGTSGVAPGSYDLFVGSSFIASVVADAGGRARVRIDNPGFDPRREPIELRQGASVIFAGPLLAQLPSLVAMPSLSIGDVETVIAQAVAEAQRLDSPETNTDAVVAVVDRVGNVLGIFEMTGAPPTITITSGRGVTTGLEALGPRPLTREAAISKAATAAYLSSRGNAFSTRTASQIVQENFNPGEDGRPGGPLFGVQFSQLPCGDLVRRVAPLDMRGPKRLPLGFSADPGGLPLYIRGVPVGGVGVEADGIYGADASIFDRDTALEERIATAATRGFAAPADIRADRIAVDGRYLRFADDERAADLPVPAFATLPGSLVAAPPFTGAAPAVVAGTAFLTPASGIVATTQGGLPAEALVDAMGDPAYPPVGSPLVDGPTASEVDTLLSEALRVAERTRAQIRRPAGSKARVSISVVDRDGTILGIIRGRDAPLFGIDVSLQKARAAVFFSRPDADQALIDARTTIVGEVVLGNYGTALEAFTRREFGDVAFSNRALGNLARPFFPDGINSKPNGPLSRPFEEWSPFSTGLQLELVIDSIGQALELLPGGDPSACTSVPGLANGIQIFPGSVLIYRGGQLVGAIGVSGDGVDQDDMVAFLGLHEAGQATGTIANAARELRSDSVSIDGVRLRYVNCPVKPFLDSSEQDACGDK
jgi:uncharacterized protein GlcG (DUF336 family)